MSDGPYSNRDSLRLGIVVPTLNAAGELAATLNALAVPTPGIDCDVLVVDGGSTDETLDIVQRYGARIAAAEGGRGPQLAAGAATVLGDWLLFVHADTRLPPDWPARVAAFAGDPARADKAGYFRFALDVGPFDADAARARRLERLVAWRCRRLGLPHGDQGLLIARSRYEAAGGYPPMPLMEDVALVRRIGARDLVAIDAPAAISPARYRRDGYWLRGCRDLIRLLLSAGTR